MKMHELRDRLIGPAPRQPASQSRQGPEIVFGPIRQVRTSHEPRTGGEFDRRPNFVNQLVHLKDATPESSGGAATQELGPAEMNPPESVTNAVPQQAVAELFRLSGDFEERISELAKGARIDRGDHAVRIRDLRSAPRLSGTND